MKTPIRLLLPTLFLVTATAAGAAPADRLWEDVYRGYAEHRSAQAPAPTPQTVLVALTDGWTGFRTLLAHTEQNPGYRRFVQESLTQSQDPRLTQVGRRHVNHHCPVGDAARRLCKDLAASLQKTPRNALAHTP